MGLGVGVSGFRGWGFGFRDCGFWGFGIAVLGLGLGFWGSGIGALGFRVQPSKGLRVV